MGFVHVDDVCSGLLAAYEQGKSGRDYILVARTASLGEVLTEVAQLAGKSAPWWWLPPWMVRLSVPFSPLVALALGQGLLCCEIPWRCSTGCTLTTMAAARVKSCPGNQLPLPSACRRLWRTGAARCATERSFIATGSRLAHLLRLPLRVGHSMPVSGVEDGTDSAFHYVHDPRALYESTCERTYVVCRPAQL